MSARSGAAVLPIILALLLPLSSSAGEAARLNVAAGATVNYIPQFDDLTAFFLTKTYDSYNVRLGWDTRPSDDNVFSAFAELFNYPVMGFGFTMTNFDRVLWGDSHLDNHYALYGFFERPWVRTERHTFGYTFQLGAAYTPGKYDPYLNPGNEFGGSHFLVNVGAGLMYRYHITPKWEIGAEASFLHFSNGKTRMPNGAINQLCLGVEARYHLDESYSGKQKPRFDGPLFEKGLRWDIGVIGGVKQLEGEWQAYNVIQKVEDKRTEFTTVAKIGLSVGALYRYSAKFGTGLQADILYTSNSKAIATYDTMVHGETSKASPVSVGLAAVQEMYYNRFATYFAVGAYLYQKGGICEDLSHLYQKIGFRYYFPSLGGTYLGWFVKSFQFCKADYLEFTLGVRI